MRSTSGSAVRRARATAAVVGMLLLGGAALTTVRNDSVRLFNGWTLWSLNTETGLLWFGHVCAHAPTDEYVRWRQGGNDSMTRRPKGMQVASERRVPFPAIDEPPFTYTGRRSTPITCACSCWSGSRSSRSRPIRRTAARPCRWAR